MGTAAQTIADVEQRAALRGHPRRRPRAREAPRARHARLRPRRACDRRGRRGPRDDGRAGRRGAVDGDRARCRAAARRTPRSRTPCSATGSTSTTRTRTRSATSRAVVTPGLPRRRRGCRCLGARRPDGDRGGQRGRHPRRHGRVRALPPRAASIRPRSAASSAASPRSARLGGLDRGDDDAGARHRRLDGVGNLRLPRGRDADEADPPGLGGPRRPPRDAARRRTAPRGRSPSSRASSASTTRSSAPSRARSDIAGQLADLGSRWETPRIAYKPYPVCHFMHGIARRRRPGARRAHALARTRSTRSWSPCPEAGVSLVLEPAAQKKVPRSDYEGKFSLQYSVASMLVRGHVAVSDFTERRDLRPGRARASRPRSATRRRSTPTYPQAFPGGVRVRLTSGETLERRLPVPEGRPGEPAVARARSGRSSARTRRSRCRTQASRRSRRRSSPSRSRTTWPPRWRPLTLREVARYDGPRGARPRSSEILAAVREFVDRDVIPVASDLEHADEFPTELVATMARDGPLRDDDPGGVRRPRPRPRHLRDDRDRALAGLDDAARGSSTAPSSPPT